MGAQFHCGAQTPTLRCIQTNRTEQTLAAIGLRQQCNSNCNRRATNLSILKGFEGEGHHAATQGIVMQRSVVSL